MLEITKDPCTNVTSSELDRKGTDLNGTRQQVSFLRWINPFATAAKTSDTIIEPVIEEYKGVQSLKQFWNNRLCAVKEARPKSATLSGFCSQPAETEASLSASKSITCLSANHSRSFGFQEAKNHNQIDNFYKYKTAATRKRICENATNDLIIANASNNNREYRGKIQKLASFGANFPLVAVTGTGEKIHWARREDIFMKRKQKGYVNENEMKVDDTPELEPLTSSIISCDKEKACIDRQNIANVDMNTKSCLITATCETKSCDKTDSGRSCNGSTNSLSSESPARKKFSTPRKYSFKTHAKSYHPSRKMAANAGGSKVAALTQQFNQFIQKDSALLEEVKKKNGVLMMRAGHVYKIKEESEVGRRKIGKRNVLHDDALTKTNKKRPIGKKQFVTRSLEGRNEGTVRATIQIFENHDKIAAKTVETPPPAQPQVRSQKPEIPLKSEQVLLRTKEIAIRNSKKRMRNSSTNNAPKALRGIQEEMKMVSEEVDCNDAKKPAEPENLCSQLLDEAATNPMTDEANVPNTDVSMTPSEDAEKVHRKSNYQRLYEKFLFRTPFTTGKKTIQESASASIVNTQKQGDQKIVEALNVVSIKLDHLSKSTSDMKEITDGSYEEMQAKMEPNKSFLFRKNPQISSYSSVDETSSNTVVEAVNTRLISKARSMDESKFPSFHLRQISLEEREYPRILTKTDELLSKFHEEEDLYEPIVTSRPSDHQHTGEKSSTFLFRTNNDVTENKVPEKEESIYQTVLEDRSNHRNSITSYESYDNYESVTEDEPKDIPFEDEYEVCDPPEPPPPRKSETSDPPLLPNPKRVVPQCTNAQLKPAVVPPRPPKSPQIKHFELPAIPKDAYPYDPPKCGQESKDNGYDDENLYDTIKGSETNYEYEMLNNKTPKSIDAMSVTSNCYESINSLRRVPELRHAESVSTLASEQKTNSLYGMTIGNNSNNLHETSSDNSDGWVDISDAEDEMHRKHHFIVVRERAKHHRSPVWSKKVRDQRIHQQNTDYGDDSDHYYEPLFPLKQNERAEKQSEQQTQSKIVSDQLSQLMIPDTSYSGTTTGENVYSDEYDSFDTEDDTDDDVKKHDSGVDISTAKLPDPPPSTNQVYAFVKKFKNFISNRKPTTGSNPKSKPYENTQFYVSSDNEYLNMNASESKVKSAKVKTQRPPRMRIKLNPGSDDPYENTEFHTPRTPSNTAAQTPDASSSQYNSPVLNHSENLPVSPPEVISRKKSKSGKSFKSKFRKSIANNDAELNIGNSLYGTRSTFYISDSVDMDSGIFEKAPQSEINLSQSSINEATPDNKCSTVVRKPKKIHSPDLNRRKTTIGIRPNNPPPPPPVDKKSNKKRSSTTSWYAECGVFKASSINNDQLINKKDRGSNTSWYAEAGLYQTSGASVASSSGSSGVSTGGEGGPGDENSHSMFCNEPLYQIYSAAKLESISRDMEDQDSTDGYEEINSVHKIKKKTSRPTALQLVGPKQGPSRTLWSEIPEVINSEILSTLTPTERRLQEAKFEILTSEASYLKSLNLLRTHFMNHPAFRDTSILSSSDRKTLFAQIVPVQECSDRLLRDLESCWQDNIMLLGLSRSIFKHAEKYFHVYIKFCEHQGKMDRTLRKLKEAKGEFSRTLEATEADPVCCALNLHSFLMLPMQRITRLPLLIDAVFSKLKPNDDEYENWKMTLTLLNRIVSQCNEAANRCEQAYEIERISRQIEFPANIRSIAIAPVGVPAPGMKPRALIKKGELVHLVWRGDDAKLTFGKKFSKCNIYIFLFTDLVVFTKRRGDEQYLVFDYCLRSLLTVSSGEVIPQLPTKDITQAGRNLILMTLLENYEGKTIEMLLSCPSVSEQQRWLQATTPPEPETPGEKLYEQWDCPQVIAKHEYCATEPDLLSLEPGDVINVTRKMADGWFQGERIRDGATGWFPGNFAEEVNSSHVRARNLKQRYRLLTLTATYLESQKRKS